MTIINRVRSLFVVRITARSRVAMALRQYAERHWKRLPVADRFIVSAPSWVRPLKRVAEVVWETPAAQPAVFLAGKVPVMLGGVMHQNDVNPHQNMVVVSAIRGSIDIEAVIVSAMKEFNDRQNGIGGDCKSRHFVKKVIGRGMRTGQEATRSNNSWLAAPKSSDEEEMQHVSRFFGWNDGDVGADQPKSPMAILSLAPVLQDAAVEFERWLSSRDWYISKCVPWRRGWLLYGVPGTGKTSFVRAIAQQHDLPVYSFDLSTLSNEELVSEWKEMQESSPCIALIEDIDGVFNGRINVLRESGSTLTFDCLLNCLSGIQTADGVFTIATTNCLESIDPALGTANSGSVASSRPGRLDRVIEVPALSKIESAAIVNRIVGEWPNEAKLLINSIQDGTTAAQVTEMCISTAQRLFWSQQK